MSGCGITITSYNIIWQCMVGGRHSNISKLNVNVRISYLTVRLRYYKVNMWNHIIRLWPLNVSI